MMRIAPARCRPLRDGRVEGAARVETRVNVKAAPDSPEVPLAGALVRVLGAHDGCVVWRGQSDAAGNYSPTGLRSGRSYIPLAVHPAGTYEAVAAGPMLADSAKRVALQRPAYVSLPFAHRLDVAGAVPPCVVRHKSGALPGGMSYSVHDGLTCDTPLLADAGDYPIVFTVSDALGDCDTAVTLRVVYLPQSAKLTGAPAYFATGGVYAAALSGVGGKPPYSYSVLSGALPSGLSFDTDTGEISGTVAAPGSTADQSYSVTLRVTDASAVIHDLLVQGEPVGILAMAYACNMTDRTAYSLAAVSADQTARANFSASLEMWRAAGVADPPLKYAKSNSPVSIASTSGTVPLRVTGLPLRLEASNGTYTGDTQDGLYEFLDAGDNPVFTINSYYAGPYAIAIRYKIGAGGWVNVPRAGYGAGYIDLAFATGGVTGTPNAGTNNPGSFSASLDTTGIVKLRATTSAASNYTSGAGGAAYTMLRALSGA